MKATELPLQPYLLWSNSERVSIFHNYDLKNPLQDGN